MHRYTCTCYEPCMPSNLRSSCSVTKQQTVKHSMPSHIQCHACKQDPGGPGLFFCRMYTYGDLPLPGHLEVSGQVLGRFERASQSLEVPLESRWSQPVRGEGWRTVWNGCEKQYPGTRPYIPIRECYIMSSKVGFEASREIL